MTTPMPLREGLFRETETGPTLLASRCTTCGHLSYPAADWCPECHSDASEIIELGGEGELHAATIVHMGNQRFQPGYAVGYVVMPQGVRIFSQLGVTGDDLPSPGTQMRLEILPLWREDDQDILAYRFVRATRKETPHA